MRVIRLLRTIVIHLCCFLIGQISRPKHGITRTKGTNIRFKSKFDRALEVSVWPQITGINCTVTFCIAYELKSIYIGFVKDDCKHHSDYSLKIIIW